MEGAHCCNAPWLLTEFIANKVFHGSVDYALSGHLPDKNYAVTSPSNSDHGVTRWIWTCWYLMICSFADSGSSIWVGRNTNAEWKGKLNIWIKGNFSEPGTVFAGEHVLQSSEKGANGTALPPSFVKPYGIKTGVSDAENIQKSSVKKAVTTITFSSWIWRANSLHCRYSWSW